MYITHTCGEHAPALDYIYDEVPTLATLPKNMTVTSF